MRELVRRLQLFACPPLHPHRQGCGRRAPMKLSLPPITVTATSPAKCKIVTDSYRSSQSVLGCSYKIRKLIPSSGIWVTGNDGDDGAIAGTHRSWSIRCSYGRIPLGSGSKRRGTHVKLYQGVTHGWERHLRDHPGGVSSSRSHDSGGWVRAIRTQTLLTDRLERDSKVQTMYDDGGHQHEKLSAMTTARVLLYSREYKLAEPKLKTKIIGSTTLDMADALCCTQ